MTEVFNIDAFVTKYEREAEDLLARFAEYETNEWESVRVNLSANGTNVELNDKDVYGDGDQSLVYDAKKQQFLRDIWAAGADVQIKHLQADYPKFITAVMNGDLKTVQKFLTEDCQTAEDRALLLEKRLTILRLPALILAVIGHRAVKSAIHGDAVGVVKCLLENGARCNARDLLGKTVIDYAVGALCETDSPVLLDIADLCIARSKEVGIKRALVDYQDRFGDTALMMAVMMNRVDLVSYLMKQRADPSIDNLDGICAFDIAVPDSSVKEILEDHDNVAPQCTVCSSTEHTFACRCGVVHYCSRDCQRMDWNQHKKCCGVVKFEIAIVPVQCEHSIDYLEGEKMKLWTGDAPSNYQVGDIFEVCAHVGPTPDTPIVVNDKSGDLYTEATADVCQEYSKLYDLVHSFTAFAGRKAYFKAKIEPTGKLWISSSEMFIRHW